MRFLKKKVALAAQAKEQQAASLLDDQKCETTTTSCSPDNISDLRTNTDPKKLNTKSTKTIVKNYGKAIASFAVNKIAKPYLSPLLKKEGIKLKDFIKHMTEAKESIEGIDTFRALLLIQSTDNAKDAGFKKIFQQIAEVFIKYFSVNWIFSGKMTNKEAHLKSRFKMLRRVRNPEFFTYLK